MPFTASPVVTITYGDNSTLTNGAITTQSVTYLAMNGILWSSNANARYIAIGKWK